MSDMTEFRAAYHRAHPIRQMIILAFLRATVLHGVPVDVAKARAQALVDQHNRGDDLTVDDMANIGAPEFGLSDLQLDLGSTIKVG